MAKKKVQKAEEPVVAAVPEVASSAATQAVLKTSGEEDARAAAEKKAWCVYKPTHPLIHGQKHFKITFSQFKSKQ